MVLKKLNLRDIIKKKVTIYLKNEQKWQVECKFTYNIPYHLCRRHITLKLWTVQPLLVYEKLKQGNIYRCDEQLCLWKDIDDFQRAHQWISQQMEKKISLAPEGVKYPIWAWHTINWKHNVPDLRKSLFRNFKDDYVCIELEIPDEKVLLSDYNAWKKVLNDQYIDFSFTEEEHKKIMAEYNSFSDEEKEVLKHKSWENIFFVLPVQNGWIQTGRYIQASFWEIRPEYIKGVRYINRKK